MASPAIEPLPRSDLELTWPILSASERAEGFRILDLSAAEEFFRRLSSADQAELLLALPSAERRPWMRYLPPDDAADLVQNVPSASRLALLELLDESTLRQVNALLAYAEDAAGGLMNPLFYRLRPEMRADEAIAYLRRQGRDHRKPNSWSHVIDPEGRLVGLVSLAYLFSSSPETLISDLMLKEFYSVKEETDQEAAAGLFAAHDLSVLPVVDREGRMKGVITAEDVVDVVREEAAEDIQKLGGMEALDAPYWRTSFGQMIRKRAGWLTVLFLGEMLTATAMAHYQEEIARAVILALFVPLIISSGGNSGSQATSLIIRAMALGEVGLRDWWRVCRREFASGLALGLILGAIGLVRILVWQWIGGMYGPHYLAIASTVSASLVGVVLWGTLAGSMLPFVLRSVGFDPASASAPFVATLVDVTGLMIYFTIAAWILQGSLL